MKRPTALAALTLFGAASATAALPIGAKAPDFATQAALAGKPFGFRLADALRKGPVVLYFFPAAFTPGCTVEAHDFAAAAEDFSHAGATLIGLSADPIDKLARFSTEECRNRFAVGTATPTIIRGFDVTLPSHAGLTNRTSYVIAPDGRVAFVYSAMSPANHVAGTLGAVKQITGK